MEFRNAFRSFMELHAVNDSLARGIAPAVFPRDDANPAHIEKAAAEVDLASGRASAAVALTNCAIAVQGLGVIDPIAAWSSIRKPRPV